MSTAQKDTAADAPADAEEFEFLKLHVRLGSNETISCDAAPEFHLVELLRASGVPVKAECGGAGACATCHIRVAANWRDKVPAPTDEELDKLDEIPGADDTSRLACQITMTDDLDGLEIEIQPDSLAATTLEAAE